MTTLFFPADSPPSDRFASLEFSENSLGRLIALALLGTLHPTRSDGRSSGFLSRLHSDLLAGALWHAATLHASVIAASSIILRQEKVRSSVLLPNFLEICFDTNRWPATFRAPHSIRHVGTNLNAGEP